MIYCLIEDIFALYVTQDILQAQGCLRKKISFSIIYFDVNKPRLMAQDVMIYRPLQELAVIVSNTLPSSASLFMKQRDCDYSVSLHYIDKKNAVTQTLFYHSFQKKLWNPIKKSLVDMGFPIKRHHHSDIQVFSLQKNTYIVKNSDGKTFVTIQSPNKNELIEALAVIGYALDEARIISKDLYQQYKI